MLSTAILTHSFELSKSGENKTVIDLLATVEYFPATKSIRPMEILLNLHGTPIMTYFFTGDDRNVLFDIYEHLAKDVNWHSMYLAGLAHKENELIHIEDNQKHGINAENPITEIKDFLISKNKL